jgi:urea transporter
MRAWLAWWKGLCGSSWVARFADVNLRGVGQVMFQNNPLTGLLFLLAVVWGSYAAGVPQVAAGGLVAVLVATMTAQWLRVDEAGLAAGLYGYNAYLVGLALPTFLPHTPLLWIYAVLGATVSVVATTGAANVFKTWGVAALTAPFVLVTWLLLLAAQAFLGLGGSTPPGGDAVIHIDPAAADPLHIGDFLLGVLHSISQVFLKASVLSALLFIAGLAVSSLPAAGFALGGALVAVITAHLFGAESELITGGLLGFSPVLTAVALGSTFYRPSLRVSIYALLGTVFTVFAQAALNVALMPLAVPALTAPFVLTSWLFLLPQQHFDKTAPMK